MADIIRKRLTGKEEGFTLIELLVVIVILGILMAIAVPSYMGFRDRASKSAAQADVRAAIPSVEAYYSDHGSYADDSTSDPPATFDIDFLKTIDQGLNAEVVTIKSVDLGAKYCISAKVGGFVAAVTGPGGVIEVSAKADDTTVAECS
jgi:prepilin-type N-terminal cleavage/methylation domain-containing protein